MEQQKIRGAAKSLILENGIELTYCERGEQNKDVIVCGAFSCLRSYHAFRRQGQSIELGRLNQLNAAMGQ